MIYLDNAATTYPKPESVLKALDHANRNAFNSGRGSYKVARDLTKLIDDTRSKLLKLNHMEGGDVIFTSSATQALNDLLFHIEILDGDTIYVSPFEHNSIVRVLERLKQLKKINVVTIPFEKNTWDLNVEKLKNLFVLHKPKVILLSHVSNVTGFRCPFEQIFELGKEYHAIHILDSSQAFGVLKIEDYTNINYIVFAGHKSLYASFGIAGFIKLKQDKLNPFIFGGTGTDTMNPVMSSFEAGSYNIVAIAGLNASLDWIMSVDIWAEEEKMTKYLIQELQKLRKVHLFLPTDSSKVFGVVSFGVEGYTADEVGKILDDEFNICVRTGFHCAPLVHDFIDSLEYHGTVRCSLSYFTTKDEIDALISALKTL